MPEEVPLVETHTLKPVSPYAVDRVSQEMLSKGYVDGFGLDIVITRSINHIGPGQRDMFVVSSFAKQCVEIKIRATNPEVLNVIDNLRLMFKNKMKVTLKIK